LLRESPSALLFVSERGEQLTRAGFQKLVARAGKAAAFAFGVHTHMRHACGYNLAEQGSDTLAIQGYL
jgi:type 1 fimbriae regulatory protein FimE